MAAGLRNGFAHLARLVQVLLNHGEGLRREGFHILILAGVGFILEIGQVFFVIFDHLLGVDAIKSAAAQVGQAIVGLLFVPREFGGKSHIFLLRCSVQLISDGAAFDHGAFAESLHNFVRTAFAGKPSQLNLRDIA